MDSFRQSSLYDAFGRQQSTSSIMNSASNASSRLASPAISSSVLGRTGAAPAPSSVSKPPLSSKSTTPANPDDNSGSANAYPGMMGYYGYGNMGNGSQYGLGGPYTASNAGSSVNLSSTPNLVGTGTPGPHPQLGAFGYGNAPFSASNYGNQYGFDQINYGSGENYGFSDSRRSSVIAPITGTSPLAAARGLDPGTAHKSNQGLGIGAGAAIPGLNGAPAPQLVPNALQDLNQFVPPGAIFWHYIDLNRQEQGPFSGLQMHEWLEYLLDSTLLRRHNDQLFVSFAVLKQVLKTEMPFIAQLTEAAWNEHIQMAQQRERSLEAPPGEGEAIDKPSGGTEPDPLANASEKANTIENTKPPALAEASSDSANTTAIAAAISAPASASDVAASQAAPQASKAAVNEAASNVAQGAQADQPPSFAPKDSAPAETEAVTGDLGNLHISVQEPTKKVFTRESSALAEQRRAEPANAPTSDPWKKPARSAQVKIADIKQQAMENQKKKSSEPAGSRKTGQGRWMPLEQIKPGSSSPLPPNSPQVVSPNLSSAQVGSPGTTGVTWGKKQVTPARSLADVQREQKELQQQQQQQQQQKARSMAAALTPVHNVTAAAGITKSAADEAKSGRFAALDAAAPAVNATRGNLSSQRAPSSHTSAANVAHSGPAGTAGLRNAERSHSVTPNSASVNANGSGNPADVAPNVVAGGGKPRAVRPAPMSITARASMASPADELVHWVRVSFKDLVKGVDGMELLDVFLSLGNNKTAKEFIAESIFEYSKSLDGRKFASDFLSRKKTAEDAMRSGETWRDVLSRFNPNAVVETDPSFKVVSKKRTQKIARPGDGF